MMRCADGWFVLSLARPDDFELVAAWLESPVGVDTSETDEMWAFVERSICSRAVAGLRDRAALLGLPGGVVGETTTGQPVVLEHLGDAPARPFEGALVVNLAALWAGPLAADLLGRMGARVITVESTRRPDGGRLARRFFSALHGRSESVALDLHDARGRAVLRALLSVADVVIEGSRPRAMTQMGIEPERFVRNGPRVWVSITAHGRAGSAGRRVGFGDDAAAAGGLIGWVDETPRFLVDAVADPLTGLTAATAVRELWESGGRWMADIALARVARSAVGEVIQSSGDVLQRPRPRHDPGRAMPLGRDTKRVLAEFGIAEV